ncbi:GNAT family N-acetyltransferase [Bacteroidota bacterium]
MTNTEKLNIKKATKSDAEIILKFIKKLAAYEKLSQDVTATKDILIETLFGKDSNAECLIGYYNSRPVCFALYFYNFSTFKGKRGLYLEDLFVIPEERGKGFGKQMLIHLAQIAKSKKCGRFEWSVLDWNEPAINFYKKIGAIPLDGWTLYRLDEEGINNLIES